MTNAEKSRIQKEIVDSIPPIPRGRIHVAPRVGKTKIVIDLIKREKPKSILWVTPSRELADKDIPQEFNTWKARTYAKRLTTTTWASLNKQQGYYDMIVLDEEHHATENNLSAIITMQLSAKSIIGMSGTPSRDATKIALFNTLQLPVLFEMDLNEAVDVELLSDYRIHVLMLPRYMPWLAKYGSLEQQKLRLNVGVSQRTGNLINITGSIKGQLKLDDEQDRDNGGKLYKLKDKYSRVCGYYFTQGDTVRAKFTVVGRRFEISNGVVHKPYSKYLMVAPQAALGNSSLKTRAVLELLKNKRNQRNLIFASSILQAESLSKFTYHSKTHGQYLREFKMGRINTLAMVNAGGTGHTYREVDNLILVQADSDKNGTSTQKICRTLLQQHDYRANIYIPCVRDTQDEVWVKRTLTRFDKEKISYHEYSHFIP